MGKGRGQRRGSIQPSVPRPDKVAAVESRISLGQMIGQAFIGAGTAIGGMLEQLPYVLWIPLALLACNEGGKLIRLLGNWWSGVSEPIDQTANGLLKYAPAALLAVIVAALIWIGQANKIVANPDIGPRYLHNKQVASVADLQAPLVVGKTVYLADIPRVDGAITDKQFESCNIIGPGVLVTTWINRGAKSDPSLRSVIENCTFDANAIESFMLVIDKNTPVIRGTVRLHGASFKDCKFYDVGAIGPPAARDAILKFNPEIR